VRITEERLPAADLRSDEAIQKAISIQQQHSTSARNQQQSYLARNPSCPGIHVSNIANHAQERQKSGNTSRDSSLGHLAAKQEVDEHHQHLDFSEGCGSSQ